ncbi:hypothetical protein PanWU01x14_350820 [Parasponia andersonii]|uniref:Uncharacterized protein n=1 Tax=Parasponia andersonii TaxID=3476 RepID=A0A2P5AAT4_PARAD|nr:hypothetical protein PanWU01x14_350820 [Parasponia andersonii]
MYLFIGLDFGLKRSGTLLGSLHLVQRHPVAASLAFAQSCSSSFQDKLPPLSPDPSSPPKVTFATSSTPTHPPGRHVITPRILYSPDQPRPFIPSIMRISYRSNTALPQSRSRPPRGGTRPVFLSRHVIS